MKPTHFLRKNFPKTPTWHGNGENFLVVSQEDTNPKTENKCINQTFKKIYPFAIWKEKKSQATYIWGKVLIVWFNLNKCLSANARNSNQTRLDQIKMPMFNKCGTLGWTETARLGEKPTQTWNHVFLFPASQNSLWEVVQPREESPLGRLGDGVRIGATPRPGASNHL